MEFSIILANTECMHILKVVGVLHNVKGIRVGVSSNSQSILIEFGFVS